MIRTPQKEALTCCPVESGSRSLGVRSLSLKGQCPGCRGLGVRGLGFRV